MLNVRSNIISLFLDSILFVPFVTWISRNHLVLHHMWDIFIYETCNPHVYLVWEIKRLRRRSDSGTNSQLSSSFTETWFNCTPKKWRLNINCVFLHYTENIVKRTNDLKEYEIMTLENLNLLYKLINIKTVQLKNHRSRNRSEYQIREELKMFTFI